MEHMSMSPMRADLQAASSEVGVAGRGREQSQRRQHCGDYSCAVQLASAFGATTAASLQDPAEAGHVLRVQHLLAECAGEPGPHRVRHKLYLRLQGEEGSGKLLRCLWSILPSRRHLERRTRDHYCSSNRRMTSLARVPHLWSASCKVKRDVLWSMDFGVITLVSASV
jgi:hypothetical protein